MVVVFVCQICSRPNSWKQTMITVIQYSFNVIIIMLKHCSNQYLRSAPEAVYVFRTKNSTKWAISTEKWQQHFRRSKIKGSGNCKHMFVCLNTYFPALSLSLFLLFWLAQNQALQRGGWASLSDCYTQTNRLHSLLAKKGIKQAQIRAKNMKMPSGMCITSFDFQPSS